MATQTIPERDSNPELKPSPYLRIEQLDNDNAIFDTQDEDTMILGIPKRPRSRSSNASIDTEMVHQQLTPKEKMNRLINMTVESIYSLLNSGERYFILYSDNDLIMHKIVDRVSKRFEVPIITIDDCISEQQKERLKKKCITRIVLTDDCITYESTELTSFYSIIKDEKYTVDRHTIDPLQHIIIIESTASVLYDLFHNEEFVRKYEDQFIEKFNSFNCILK